MSQEVEIEDETILNLPSIEERLGALRPSRQLLEFYRRKTEELETEHDKLFNKIEGKGSQYYQKKFNTKHSEPHDRIYKSMRK